jgi:hypothetical protein
MEGLMRSENHKLDRLVYEVKLFIRKVGILKSLTILILSIFALLRIVAIFLPDQFVSISKSSLFESLVIIALIEIMAILLNRDNRSGIHLLWENDVDDKLGEILKTKKIDKVYISTTDINCRTHIIPYIINKYNIPIKVFHNSFSNDDEKRKLLEKNIKYIHKSIRDREKLKLLDLIPDDAIKTLRAIILCDPTNRQNHYFMSWYKYKQDMIESTENPTVFITMPSDYDRQFLERFLKIMEE